MTNILDKHAPPETRTVTDKPAAPWMTATTKEAKAERRRAERTWGASKLTVHRSKDIFKQCNSKVKNLISAAKWVYYNKQIDACLTSIPLLNVIKIAMGKSDDVPKSINTDFKQQRGCILPPSLFNLYSEYLLQEAISEKNGILINGVNINNIRYADDTVALAESEEQLQAILDRIVDKCKEYGLEINAEKTKTMHIGRDTKHGRAGLEIFIPRTHDHGGCCHSKRGTHAD
ncbi:endonuclease-reverse transcriptase [Elysia marginata]|uniref:Endonuclease-reverse transcriptase n=1 Tax=Elysia marginata TaxID=1093978 RepID=A0AAV4I550_9GAST|nr:endonuclease-reverse transcriptase [Elysia marginata]